jgi:L-ascorbate metabolism protein UlaG (beta-lactamase superfamily)
MIKSTITRRQFLKNGLRWCGMAAIPALSSACGGRSAAKIRQIATEAENISLREIADRKLHHGNGCFLNLFGGPLHGNPWRPSLSQSVKNWDSILYNYSYKPYYKDERVVPVSIDWEVVANNPELSITFIKHACIMIKDRNQCILIDPVFFDLPVVKAFTPLDFDIKDMPAPDHVLITHGHYDHLDVPSLSALIPQTHVISPLGYNSVFNDLKMNYRTQLDWYDTYEQDGTAIKLLPCMHWTMRNPLKGANHSLCGSFLIKTTIGATILISGDTSYFRGFREIGNEFSIDLAIINLGGYAHGAPVFMSHLNPRQAVQGFRDLRARHLLIVHWGSFRLTSEPVHFPPIQLQAELTKAGLADRLLHLNHGETLYYG